MVVAAADKGFRTLPAPLKCSPGTEELPHAPQCLPKMVSISAFPSVFHGFSGVHCYP